METLVKNITYSAVDEKLSGKIRDFFKPSNSVGRKKFQLFIVDDDPMYLRALEMSIASNNRNEEMMINTFQTGEACLQQMKFKPSVVVLDYFLNSKFPYAWDGATILKQIKRISPETKVIMISGQDSLKVAIECMENGAYDYVSKSQTALLRINTIIKNICGNLEVSSLFFKVCAYILLFAVVALIAFSIINI